MCQRVEGKIEAAKTPIGYLPLDGDIDLSGLDIDPEDFAELTEVDVEAFKADTADAEAGPLRTTLAVDSSRTLITRNDSPDVPFDRAITPYRGCEHGCVYCYARPGHAWLGLSPGLDFESRLFCKPDAAALLRRELAARAYRPAPMAVGSVTDAYQPVERSLGITSQVLTVLAEAGHPATVITKSALVARDGDILRAMAADRLAAVTVSLTTLDRPLARRLEPRAASPDRRLETIATLAAAGIPTGVLVAPVIPGLTDAELEHVLARARDAGATFAGYVLLRLPGEVAPLFRDWLARHAPEAAGRVLGLVRDARGGRDNDPRFGVRMRGEGPVADLIARRFELAHRRLGFAPAPEPDCGRFRRPAADPAQLDLF